MPTTKARSSQQLIENNVNKYSL